MNPKRLTLAILAVFVGIWLTDFLIHGVWLKSTYQETMSLWRPEAEMQAHMGWLMLGQLLFAAIFVLIWANGFPATPSLRGACLYGLCMGVLSQSNTLITYAVQPFPASLAAKWIVAGLAQGLAIGALVYFVYRPKTTGPKSDPAQAP
jgi:hypothetical protein